MDPTGTPGRPSTLWQRIYMKCCSSRWMVSSATITRRGTGKAFALGVESYVARNCQSNPDLLKPNPKSFFLFFFFSTTQLLYPSPTPNVQEWRLGYQNHRGLIRHNQEIHYCRAKQMGHINAGEGQGVGYVSNDKWLLSRTPATARLVWRSPSHFGPHYSCSTLQLL